MQVCKETINGVKSFCITWPSSTISPKSFIYIAEWIQRNPDYSPMTDSKKLTISRCANTINKSTGDSVTFDQVVSLRHIIIKSIVIERYVKMNTQIDKITSEYNSGSDILELSHKYNYPPLNLLYGILLTDGVPKKTVYNVFKGDHSSESQLAVRDKKQYHMAYDRDAQSTFNQNRVAKVAKENEDIVVNYFKSMGIKIKDEKQLVEEQIAEHGRAVNTPDILFIDPVYINNVRVYWLDYKDYVGTSTLFLYRSNVQQTCRYFKEWGQGALCFHHSFVEGLSIPGAILVDARSLPVKLIKI